MPSQKLIRCRVRRVGDEGHGTSRYIPLEIFGLWDYMMAEKHGFEVLDPRASLWLDMEDSPETAYGENQYERVTEVTAFVYSGRDEMFTRCCRYFPTPDLPRLKPIFLSHYEDHGSRLQTHVRERQGIWLIREPATAEV
jgi:hypothetical protein